MTIIKKETVEKVANKYDVDVNILEAVVELINESNDVDINAFMSKVDSTIKGLGYNF